MLQRCDTESMASYILGMNYTRVRAQATKLHEKHSSRAVLTGGRGAQPRVIRPVKSGVLANGRTSASCDRVRVIVLVGFVR